MSLFKQIMLIIAAGMENYQKIAVNPKHDGARRYFVAVTYLQPKIQYGRQQQ